VAFFGGGAEQTGLFHECLNLASLWQLPVLLVCENNGFAEFSPISAHTVVERLADHADTYGIPTETIDGNDLNQVRPAAVAAIERARGGGGPSFLECLTHRLRGHYEGDPTRKRGPAAGVEGKDPIQRFVRFLSDGAKDSELEGIEARVRAEVEQAAEEALSAPWPVRDDLMTNVVAQT
jgi:TPP-dependent pyruvate/acetoin dehydrogenase alpha subunit